VERTEGARRRIATEIEVHHAKVPIRARARCDGVAAALGGCAAIDPHNILSRGVRTSNPDFQLNVLGEWGRAAAFDFVWDTINQNYVDPRFNGVDWAATAKKYRPVALSARNDDDFWDVLNRMTGELRDSHTRVEPPNLVQLRRRQESVSLGVELDRVEARSPSSTSRRLGRTLGGRASGHGSDQDRRLPGRRAISAGARRGTRAVDPARQGARAFRTLLLGDPETKMGFEFVRSDGTRFDATLTRKVVRAAPNALVRKLPSGYVYLRFSSFSLSLRSRVLDAISANKSAPGLIIDLRNNGGGSAFMVEEIAEQLLREPTRSARS
jgi:carboxyl-terminal processing protease